MSAGNLPKWAYDESGIETRIRTLAEIFRDMSSEEREVYRLKRREEYGRFADIIIDLALIRADAHLLLGKVKRQDGI